MKRYSRRNRNTLTIACLLGLGYAGYLIYSSQDGLNWTGAVAFGLLLLLVLVVLSVAGRFPGTGRRR